MRGTLSEHRAKPCRLTPDDSDLTFSDPSATGTSVLLIALNKPFQVLSQFTDRAGRPTLAAYLSVPGVHAAGRLDYDSEGLLLLTDDGRLQRRIADPVHRIEKRYLAQVEGTPEASALARLRAGVRLNDGPTRPAHAQRIDEPELWPRDPPVRFRRHIPTSWLEIGLSEGRNRQVRRMTAAVGHPTLRLVRISIGPYRLDDLAPGAWREVDPALLGAPLARNRRARAVRHRSP